MHVRQSMHTKQQPNVTIDYDKPIPDWGSGQATRIAKSMKVEGSALLPSRDRAISVCNALRNLGRKPVMRKELDEKTGEFLGYRVWRSS